MLQFMTVQEHRRPGSLTGDRKDTDMPPRPLKPCNHPGCSSLVTVGRCEIHQKKQKEKRSLKKRDPFYGSTRWRYLRKKFLIVNPICSRCGSKATVVHHVKEIKEGGDPFDKNNLEALCSSCHSKHHSYGRSQK